MYALAPYIGAGTLADRFRPRGSDQANWLAVDLRPDGGATLDGGGLNAALVYLPADDPDAQLIKLGDDLSETLRAARRTALQNRFGVTLRRKTLRGILWELLLVPNANAWKPLRATRDGRFLLHLGPAPEMFRTMAGGSSATESWTHADNASLTADLTWDEFSGTDWAIVSNAAKLTGNVGIDMTRADIAMATDDHYAQATLVTWTYAAGTLAGSVLVRKANDSAQTFYCFTPVQAGTADYVVEKWVTGSATTLGTVTNNPTATDVFRVSANGSQILGTLNGNDVLVATDTAIAGNLYGGIWGTTDNAGNTVVLDDWSIADIAQVGGGGSANLLAGKL